MKSPPLQGQVDRPSLVPQELPRYAKPLFARHVAHADHLRAILCSLPLATESRVLDVASGDGTYAFMLADLVGRTGQVVGVDVNEDFLTFARDRLSTLSPRPKNVELMHGNAVALPLADDAFDLVWCAHSLRTLRHLGSVLRELVRVVATDGTVAILENDQQQRIKLTFPPALAQAVRQAELWAQRERVSVSPQGAPSLAEMLTRAGLRDVQIRYFKLTRHDASNPAERFYLTDYLCALRSRVHQYLSPCHRSQLADFCNPESPTYLLDSRQLCVTYTDYMVWGLKDEA